jgi:hypothetical protein
LEEAEVDSPLYRFRQLYRLTSFRAADLPANPALTVHKDVP